MPRTSVRIIGDGSTTIPADSVAIWPVLLDPATLALLVPGAQSVERVGPDRYVASFTFGVGFLRGRYRAELSLSGLQPPERADLSGSCSGPFGRGTAVGAVVLSMRGNGSTNVSWHYDGEVSGALAVAGEAVLGLAVRMFVVRFFSRLSTRLAPPGRGLRVGDRAEPA